MSRVRPRGCPSLPWLSAFPEINVRTYVTDGAKPGVWFFSLDATNPLFVRAARWTFGVPYFDARMAVRSELDGEIHYHSRRPSGRVPPAELIARYQPISSPELALAGSLPHWLTERYCMYSSTGPGRIWRIEIDHPPWRLEPARWSVERNTMATSLGVSLAEPCPLLHFAKFQETVAWPPEKV